MIEAKVQASTAAASASGLALWSLGHWIFKGTVPDVVASWVYAAVPGILAFTAGYLARHTPRADEPAGNMPARGGYSSGSRTASELPPPPPSVTAPTPPAAAVTQPPAVAGDPGATP